MHLTFTGSHNNNHMPDEDQETRYYDMAIGKLEWRCKYMVQKAWDDEYKPTESIHVRPPLSPPVNDFWLELDAEERVEQALVDKYTQYRTTPIVFIDNAIGWRLEDTRQRIYPNLSKMALDYLSIPGMSAEPERVFSSAQITITYRRNRLGSNTIEVLECLRSCNGIRD
jgi:hAT family C-terminal dimerisation region